MSFLPDVTIRRKFLGFSAAIAILDLALLGLILLVLQNEGAIVRAEEVARRSIDLTRELRDSSDELTRLARTYVVTGDRTYERAYWNVP